MLRRPRSEPPDEAGPSSIKYIAAAILGLGVGFVIFNLSSIFSHTHYALTLSNHHKMQAFRLFMGLPEHDGVPLIIKTTAQSPSPVAAIQGSQAGKQDQKQTDAQARAQQEEQQAKQREAQAQQRQQEELRKQQEQKRKEQQQQQQKQQQQGGSQATKTETVSEEEKRQIADARAVLSTRVCGSPAVDGYAHVVPRCLEESPTNKWWVEYYKKGGKQKDLVVHIEERADYDGLAVKWGLGNTVKNAQECAEQCLNHMPNIIKGPYEKLPCNAFAFCPDDVCFEPDAHKHHKGDCWLKFTEGPAWVEVRDTCSDAHPDSHVSAAQRRLGHAALGVARAWLSVRCGVQVNMRGILPDDYMKRHPQAPRTVQWISGVLLPRGVQPTNGTFGPRWKW